MPIFPLPQFEADLEADKKLYEEKLKAPKSMVVRFGVMKLIGEFPYDGDAKPGCGSKLVLKTHRGTELGEMLTSTCPNAGCDHSVTRKDMLQYIENSGGKDYPFYTDGRVLRVATVEDMAAQAKLETLKVELLAEARRINVQLGLGMKLVEAEPILGGERINYYYASEERIDFRPLVMELAQLHHTRIEMKQVGARDEARLIADYEKCGQHCCCKTFLKVLKPVSMRSAKIQKATLDPLKISGRCGRLMCCLRYEDSTYDDLRKNLPKRKTRVMTPDGPGLVMDSQILTQLVLVALENSDEQAAYPVESIQKLDPNTAPPKGRDEDDDGTIEGAPNLGAGGASGAGKGGGGDARPARSAGPVGRDGQSGQIGQGGKGGQSPQGGPGGQGGQGRQGGPPMMRGGGSGGGGGGGGGPGGNQGRGERPRQDRAPERGPDRSGPDGRGPGSPGGPSGPGGASQQGQPPRGPRPDGGRPPGGRDGGREGARDAGREGGRESGRDGARGPQRPGGGGQGGGGSGGGGGGGGGSFHSRGQAGNQPPRRPTGGMPFDPNRARDARNQRGQSPSDRPPSPDGGQTGGGSVPQERPPQDRPPQDRPPSTGPTDNT